MHLILWHSGFLSTLVCTPYLYIYLFLYPYLKLLNSHLEDKSVQNLQSLSPIYINNFDISAIQPLRFFVQSNALYKVSCPLHHKLKLRLKYVILFTHLLLSTWCMDWNIVYYKVDREQFKQCKLYFPLGWIYGLVSCYCCTNTVCSGPETQ